ncbi:hypothetical protein CQ13_07700 [Bradyrhizobium retamae]|uniref:Uncharacterized protein n=1 Tax=Bradyrhizobium retamae TaxID=1300035 RepID=A0A0R3MP37_9BRAD|nr:hypothetical protein CQ13_07700 [Bradyrhizobium retamae]
MHCIPPQLAREIWPQVREKLYAAVRRTDLSHTVDIARDVLHGDGVLWLACDGQEIEAAAVTLLTRTDRHLVCLITALGGSNMESWLPLLSEVEDWARSEGAALVRVMGRPGWVRVLKNYHVSNVVLERAL